MTRTRHIALLLAGTVGAAGATSLASAAWAAPEEKREANFDESAVSPTPELDPTVRPGLPAELAERERRLAVAEAELEEAKKDLELARKKLEQDLEELRRLNEQLTPREEEAKRKAEEARQRKLTQLITTVEKMDPEAAAPYLDKFKTSTAAAILHGMNIRKAAVIIENMDASKAAIISRYYLKNGQPPPDRDSKRNGRR